MQTLSRQEYDKIKDKYKDEKICPFCEKNMDKSERIWEGMHFNILKNKYPYIGLKTHLLVIPKRHIPRTSDIGEDEWKEFQEVERFMKDFYSEQSYFSFIRQVGKLKSIAHLHYHYLPGEVYVDNIETMLKKYLETLGNI